MMLAFGPLFDPAAGAVEWGVVALVLAVFVPLYLAVERRPGRLRAWAPLLTALIGVAAIPVNAGASVLFVYAAAFAGSYMPRREATRWLLGLTALLGAVAMLSTIPFPYRIAAYAPPLLFVWVIGIITMEEADRERESARLRVDNTRIEHLATLAERERLARDLHDLLGQSLTSIVVRAQLAQRLGRDAPDRAFAELTEIERTARAALGEVRETVRGWRHVVLDDELHIAREALRAAGITLTLDREADVVLAPSVETAMSLALREAVTNVVRHAQATRCTVALRRVGDEVVLEVADDGVGADTAEGSGLAGMRERISALGGHVDRAFQGGTAVSIAVPASVAT